MSLLIFYIYIYIYIWRRKWHPTPVLLPGKSHGWRSLVGCSPWGRYESDMTEQLHFTYTHTHTHTHIYYIYIYIHLFYIYIYNKWGFPGGSVVKNPSANAGHMSLIPDPGRFSGRGNGNPLQYSCLENPIGRGVWQATVHGISKSWT